MGNWSELLDIYNESRAQWAALNAQQTPTSVKVSDGRTRFWNKVIQTCEEDGDIAGGRSITQPTSSAEDGGDGCQTARPDLVANGVH